MINKKILGIGFAAIALVLSAASCNSAKTANKSTTSSNAENLSATSAAVSISNFAFATPALTIKKGTTVTWTNNDTALHTVTGGSDGPASGTLAKGRSYSFTFDTVGTFSYRCTLHSGMTATVTVTQ